MYFKGSVFVFMLCNFIENSAQLCKRYSDVFLISHFLLCPSKLLFLYYHKIPIKLPCKRPPSIFGEFGIFVHDRASAPSHFPPFQKLFFFGFWMSQCSKLMLNPIQSKSLLLRERITSITSHRRHFPGSGSLCPQCIPTRQKGRSK